ncbi:unnamed protein product [Acanthoscelides obtectus]|uniref:KRAB-A domain-containing protein 2 n=1 Tax=Acanthoscelides obtectus TaxID=200917 RepID=A0A9P0JZE2_ACAOB|nr:unnamed protein product [Acanthoscelides obtectus]CAK1669704.1 KRAB-A domain-containing protein 2 [Acanthoscelides obtectus]
MMQDELVNKDAFYAMLNTTYDNCIKKAWYWNRIQETIDIVNSYKAKRLENRTNEIVSKERYYAGKYDVLKISGQQRLVIKPTEGCKDVICVAAVEEFFDIIDEQHKLTNHGKRDKLKSLLKKKYNIPRTAIETYLELCKGCVFRRPPRRVTP